MIILIDTIENAFGQIHHPFMIKTLDTLGIEGNLIMSIYKKNRVNILMVKKTECFPPKISNNVHRSFNIEIKLFSIVLEVLASTIMEENDHYKEWQESITTYRQYDSLCRRF